MCYLWWPDCLCLTLCWSYSLPHSGILQSRCPRHQLCVGYPPPWRWSGHRWWSRLSLGTIWSSALVLRWDRRWSVQTLLLQQVDSTGLGWGSWVAQLTTSQKKKKQERKKQRADVKKTCSVVRKINIHHTWNKYGEGNVFDQVQVYSTLFS